MTNPSATALVPAPDSAPQSRPPLMAARLSRRLTRRSIVPLAMLMTLIIGVGDRVTGIELPFTILYMLPIGVGTWFRSRRFGMLLSALAVGSISFSLVHDRMSTLAIAWNVLGAAALFLGATWGIDELRSHVERERAMHRMAVDQLRHADRLNVIGTLAAGVAHELGTPLNVIAGCAEFLAEDSQDAEVLRRTQMILDQITKISAIIRHLLDFGSRGGVVRSSVDLNVVAAAACEMLRSTARKRGCTIAMQLGDPIYVTANAGELEQVLSNLILNALQATDRGTVQVRVGLREGAVPPIATVEVEDQGCGIPAENLTRIFDPFFTTKGVGEGTGLGLSVSYGIVRDHDGTIEVVSEPRRGSRFTVVLPLRT